MEFEIHPWKWKEHTDSANTLSLTEKMLFAGNGYMGLDGVREEDDGRKGICIAGVPNAVCLHGMHLEVDGEKVDSACMETSTRELDLRTGVLTRSFSIRTAKGRIRVRFERFLSMAQKELLAVLCEITPEYDANITVKPYLDARIDGSPWKWLVEEESEDGAALLAGTDGEKRFALSAAMSCWVDGLEAQERHMESGCVQSCYSGMVPAGETVSLEKYALCFTTREYDEKVLTTIALRAAARAREWGYFDLKADHAAAWKARWNKCDVCIEGDEAAQQRIRFALFHLMSLWQGEDGRLPERASENCLPVYLAIHGTEAIHRLLADGTLYPDNIAVAYAMFRYAAWTGDYAWLRREGLGVLHAIAQFFVERIRYEDEGHVYSDGWYQNRMAAWCIGLFVTQAYRASQERLDHLGVTREKLSDMADLAQSMSKTVTEPQEDAEAHRALYLLDHLYDDEQIRRFLHNSTDNTDPWMRCILAARAGLRSRAEENYERAADLTAEQAAENWLMITEGFAGLRTMDGLSLSPFLPEKWQRYAFRLQYRGTLMEVAVDKQQVSVELLDGKPVEIELFGEKTRLCDRIVRPL